MNLAAASLPPFIADLSLGPKVVGCRGRGGVAVGCVSVSRGEKSSSRRSPSWEPLFGGTYSSGTSS